MANVRVVSGVHGGTTRVLVDGKELDDVIAVRWEVAADEMAVLTLTVVNVEVDVEVAEVVIETDPRPPMPEPTLPDPGRDA